MSRLFTVLLLSFLLLGPNKAKANHLLGAEINYSLVSTNGNIQVYRVTLSFFADCSSNIPGGAFEALVGAQPQIDVTRGPFFFSTKRLAYNAALSNIEITPVCPDEAGTTTCIDINNPLPGIKKFVYSGDFNLPDTSSNWRFVFDGSISTTPFITSAGRSFIINNAQIMDPATSAASILYLEATLNNTLGPNNSTTFTSLPTPFFCKDKASTYSLGAADPENDFLSFSLIPGKTSATGEVIYVPPFSGANPLPTSPGNFNFNTTSGQMNFVPNQVMNCMVTNLVEEFRNGIRVGSCMREMTFIILDNCTNDAPLSPVSGIENAGVAVDSAGNLMLNVCEGQSDSIAFDIISPDPNGDNTTVTYSNLPQGASLTITNNGADTPRIHFSWSAIDAAPGNYLFYVTYTDDGCPLVSTKTVAYTITIIEHPKKFTGNSEPSCFSASNGKAWAVPEAGQTDPYSYRWVDASGNTIRTTASSTNGDTLSNVPPGTYKVYVRNAEGCGKNVVLTVGEIPLPHVVLPGDSTLCIGMPLKVSAILQPDVRYQWNTGDTTCCITVNQPGVYSLQAINQCGAVQDDIEIRYVKCHYCLFVPNAFSPNGDGKNDRFNVLETCLIEKYKLQVFNRWGELVFTTLSTSNSWDGIYNGKEAESGVYFYRINAKLTDKSKEEIELKGDVTLIR
jgi:gliding motility-associated-like protein